MVKKNDEYEHFLSTLKQLHFLRGDNIRQVNRKKLPYRKYYSTTGLWGSVCLEYVSWVEIHFSLKLFYS